MERTKFENFSQCDFELIHYSKLLQMRDDIEKEIKKRQKERWDSYFNKVIDAITDIIQVYGNSYCMDDCEGDFTWDDVKTELVRYNTLKFRDA